MRIAPVVPVVGQKRQVANKQQISFGSDESNVIDVAKECGKLIKKSGVDPKLKDSAIYIVTYCAAEIKGVPIPLPKRPFTI